MKVGAHTVVRHVFTKLKESTSERAHVRDDHRRLK